MRARFYASTALRLFWLLARGCRLASRLHGLCFADVGFHQCHQLADGTDALQIPDCFFHPLLGAVRQHAVGERSKLFFYFLIRQRIARIAFGIIKLFIERNARF